MGVGGLFVKYVLLTSPGWRMLFGRREGDKIMAASIAIRRGTGYKWTHLKTGVKQLNNVNHQSKVRVWTESVNIPTYMPAAPDLNPMFLEKRVYQGSSGKVYPLPFTDRIDPFFQEH